MNHSAFELRYNKTVLGVLDNIKEFIDSHSITPTSIGMSRVNGGYLAVLGYSIEKKIDVSFIVKKFHLQATLDLPKFQEEINQIDSSIDDDIICHAVTVEGTDFVVIVMTA